MTGDRRSFASLTAPLGAAGGAAITHVEVPLFQRDYAQGRPGEKVQRIRTDFLESLRGALDGASAAPVGLDFVYGAVEDGTFRPLDGQQRLTTLFLLHWYLASRAGHLAEEHQWKSFSYATRQSARMFCERLGEHALPEGETPRRWITDQPWYLFVWEHDPTVQSMLVMLDAVHAVFGDVDAPAAWGRLVDADDPAVWFLLLPLDDLGSAAGGAMRPEQLYIKMNSRGKPLTEFENFKAHFEATLEWSERAHEFSLNVDTVWSDLLWELRGDDDLIDDEFLRYLEFVTEVCEWRDGRTDGAGQPIGPRTRSVFGHESANRESHIAFLFDALDTWRDNPVGETLDGLFSSKASDEPGVTRLFFRAVSDDVAPLNLFESCCRAYGTRRNGARVFSLGQTLVLYAVVVHLTERTDDFPRRVRVLRNLIESSGDELRADRMPEVLDDVHAVIREGSLDGVKTLNQAQVHDEKLKAAFVDQHSGLATVVDRLEDHRLLRGSLGAFELDEASFAGREAAFDKLMADPGLWTDLLGALLASGEYQRRRSSGRALLFGTDASKYDSAWRDLLTGATRERLKPTRQVLGQLLDRVAAPDRQSGDPLRTQFERPLDETLRVVLEEYLENLEAARRFDWRYYMVRYPVMRGGGSSTYFSGWSSPDGQPEMGYSLCKLRAGGVRLSGYYQDPYLLAVVGESGYEDLVEVNRFTGYEGQPRRLALTRSGATIRCVDEGFEVVGPPGEASAAAFEAVRESLGLTEDGLLVVPQVLIDGRGVDTTDRVQVGAAALRTLVAAGL